MFLGFLSQFLHSKSYLLAGILCRTGITGGYFLRNVDTNLHPVNLLLKAHGFHVARIVIGVINGVHRTRQMEVLHKHTFLIEVGDTQRTVYGLHAQRLAPLTHSLYQCFRHIGVVDKLYQGKPDVACLPLLVGLAIDDTHNASYTFPIPIGYERLNLRKLAGRVLFLIQFL